MENRNITARKTSTSQKVRGARSLVVQRGPLGFGFTLRHFLVYPPESYQQRGPPAEPMETIFVKNVPDGTCARAAGLSTGDRILSVNGESIHGKSYAQVVQLIQASPDRLHLVVIPKEDDVIQQCYRETAHHPQTNPRPKHRSPGLEPIYHMPDSGCSVGRRSLDASSLESSSTLTDDSLILSRIRRSCEQKEEFLRRQAVPVFPPWPLEGGVAREFPPFPLEGGVAREFYPRPQKMPSPAWPPEVSGRSTPLPGERITSRPDRNSFHRDYRGEPVRAHSEEKDPSFLRAAPHQLVFRRTRQFESGHVENDRTSLYRSELAGLSEKKAAPAVSMRKHEFEMLTNQQPAAKLSSPSRVLRPKTSVAPLGANGSDRSEELQWCDTFPPRLPPEKQRHKAVRQDSYLAAVKTVPGPSVRRIVRQVGFEEEEEEEAPREAEPPRGRPGSPARLSYSKAVVAGATRPTRLNLQAEARPEASGAVVRRPKTALSQEERAMRRASYLRATAGDLEPVAAARNKWLYPIQPGEIQRLRRLFEDRLQQIPITEVEEPPSPTLEACLQCKMVQVEGKRSADRSWKPTLVALKAGQLTLRRDKEDHDAETLDLRELVVDVPPDYTKRKHVLRLKTSRDSEYLLQAEDAADLARWRVALDRPATHSSFDSEDDAKSRKSDAQVSQTPSPKTKTWKVLGKSWRKMASGASPSSPTAPCPEGATIGLPLELCCPWEGNPLVPLLVARCTQVVEARGLDIVGVYRVPGNTAAITQLTEALKKGIHTVPPEDPRWKDVNVISSLLKAFFRLLPDSLFTADRYSDFIESDKLPDPRDRALVLRGLVELLPPHNYATLHHLLCHLSKVVANRAVNKMETKNLAIVFGPTLMRPLDLRALVVDTAQQCRILESLIAHVEWFFSDADVSALELPQQEAAPQLPDSQPDLQTRASLLIGNIAKLEGHQSLTRSKNRKSWIRRGEKFESGSTSTGTSPVMSRSEEERERPEPGPQTPAAAPTLKLDADTLALLQDATKESLLARKVLSSSQVSSLKRFKSSGDDADRADDPHEIGNNLLASLTETFEQKLSALRGLDSSDSLDGGSATEKADLESVDENECKQKPRSTPDEKEDSCEKEGEEEKEEPVPELTVLRPRNGDALVKRSGSLRADRPAAAGAKVRRSESLGKTDGRRADFLTKTEKTETNMKAKLKRAGVKEKENRRIKRRHTVGGTKDLDKLPWIDNRYSERLRDGRTSSPDLRPDMPRCPSGTPLESHV